MRIKLALLIITILIAGLFGFAVFNLNGILNKNKDLILSQIEKQVERNVEVGSIGINIWGGLGFKLSDFNLSDDKQFSSEDFIDAKELVVSLKLLPLLKKRVEIKKVILIEPFINVIKNKSGNYNFESLSKKDGKSEPESSKNGPIENFVISLVDISNGKISYDDRESGKKFEISNIDLNSKNISLDKPIKFDLSLAIYSENQNISANGEIGPIGQIPDFATTRLDIDINIEGLDIEKVEGNFPQLSELIPAGLNPGNELDLKLSASGTGGEMELKDIDIKAAVFSSKSQNLSINGNAGPLGMETEKDKLNLDLDFNLEPVQIENLEKFGPLKNSLPSELNAKGPLALSGTVNGNMDALNLLFLRLNGSDSKIYYGDKFKKEIGQELSIATDAVITPKFIDLKNTELKLNGLKLTLGGRIYTGSTIKVDIKLNTSSADLSNISQNFTLLREYGLSGNFTVDASVNGEVSNGASPEINGKVNLADVGADMKQLPSPVRNLNGVIDFRGNSAKIDGATLMLGSSEMRLDSNITRFVPLSVDYTLSSPELKLSDLSETAGKDEKVNGLTVKGSANEKNGDFQALATLKSENGKFSKINYKNLNGNIVMENGIVNFNDLDFNFLNATLKASGKYNMQSDVPSFTVDTDLKGLNITDLVKTFLNPKSEAISGNTSIKLKISGKGTDWDSISKTLDGLGSIELTEGKLADFNLADEVLSGMTGIQGLSGLVSQNLRDRYPDVFKTTNTVFYNLKSPVKIDKGKINLNNILLAASNYVVNGEGSIGLDSALDMAGRITLSDKLTGDLVDNRKIVSVLKNSDGKLQIPFSLAGNLPGVRPRPDMEFIARKIQSTVIEEGKQKLRDKLIDELSPKKDKAKNQDSLQNTTGEESQNQNEEKPVEKLIEKGLKSIFE